MNEVAWEERNHSIHPSQTRPSQHPGAGGASGPHAHPRRHANNQQSPQQQPIAEQILANGATNSAASDEMSSRGAAPQSATNNNHAGPRSQDDAMVGYFFQRPQTDPDFQNFSGGKRWALGDDSVIESRQNETELETEFQALALETENFVKQTASTKKIWGVEENIPSPVKHAHAHHHHHPHEESGKSLFLGGDPQWRDPTWSTGNASEHAVSQPILMGNRRSGSYPGSGDAPSMLSPRSTDTGGLGVKMVEYVLGSSPTNKDLESRMGRLHHSVAGADPHEKQKKGKVYDSDGKGGKEESSGHIQANGIMQNGLDEDGKGFNRAPGNHQEEDIKASHAIAGDQMMGKLPLASQPMPGHSFESPFDAHLGGMDPLQFNEYASIMQSIDSPGILDYNNQMYQQQQQRAGQTGAQGQPMPGTPQQLMHQQQQYATQQQGPPTGGPGNHYPPQGGYYQDPFTAGMGHLIPAGPPAMMPQYYGMPWGMYPAHPQGMMQNGQGQPGGPQMIPRGNGGRPLTPTGSVDSGNHNGPPIPPSPGQYPMMAPHGFFDQNGSMMMGSQQAAAAAAAARGMNPAAMRLMHTPMMMNHPNQAGGNNMHRDGHMMQQSMRMMTGGGQNGQQVNQHSGPPQLFSNNNSNGYGNNANSSLGYPNATSSALANGNAMGFNHMPAHNGQGYGNNLGPIGGALGMGNSSPRRDSFDGRRDSLSGMFSTSLDGQFSRHLGKNGQYYGPLGSGIAPSPGPIGMMPNQSPPPSINGMGLGIGQGRLSAAPGAEAKYMVRNGGPMGGRFGSSGNPEFTNRLLQRNSSIDKSTGRSRLLEDFRNNRHPALQLRDLNDHIVEFSQDQHGSRFIQQKLERATPPEKQLVFSEIIGSAYSLMTDVFGNYVIQKFFEFGSSEQKQALAMKVKGHVLPLALQMYGCRVIQKALESIPPDQQKEIVKELDGHVLKCVKDQNGNHVVQKCIECVDPHALQFIIGAFQNQVFALSTHPYGCRVIQRILEHCTPEQTAPILEELHSHTEQLVQDQYGNYVIQHVLEHGRPEDKSKLIQGVRGKVLTLSQHKFASNVVEKCVTHASRPERAFLIEEVCAYGDSDGSGLYTMMKDQYANYVVQKMIEVAEPPQRKVLLQRIRPQVAALRKYTYGKHILAKLEKYIMKNSNDLGPIGAPPNGSM